MQNYFQFPVIALYSMLTFFAPPTTYTYRDKSGSFQGRAVYSSNSVRLYDKSGSYSGRYQKSGSSYNYYNKSGGYNGWVSPSLQRVR